ncbi:MFS transporter [Arthrobacter roseus]|uniref:MFS transporter n=1 Tax=Arthrobacter roseus TaxID=136274 RepID=UPI001EF7ED8D|nr:MFS transporter [Arthrobacter roseus]MBM7849775.1 MFS family permease [Arthrobacter roseus]
MMSRRPREAARTLLQAVSVTTIGVLPAFLVGALAVQIRGDLQLGPIQLGLAAATLFAVSGILARPLGRLVQRIGPVRGMTVSASMAAIALTGVGFAPTLPLLIVALAVGGLANATAQPSANLGISRAVGPQRLGLAFGIKQSSIPAATLLAGLAVPGIALVLGWRYAFWFGGVIAVGVALWALLTIPAGPGEARVHEETEDRGTPRGGLVVLTIGGALAAGTSTSLGVFLVDSAVLSGISPGSAGLLFAASALLGLLLRIGFGAAMDRHPTRSPYILIANLLTVGVLGYVLIGTGFTPLLVAGSLLTYAAGWTWTGLLHFGVVRDNRRNAATATGVLQTGLSLGSAAGPLLFGVLVEATSYRTAWFTAGAVSLIAAFTFRAGRLMIRRSRELSTPLNPSTSANPANNDGKPS